MLDALSPPRRRRRHRDRLERQFALLTAGHSTPATVCALLTGPEQLWWQCCREALFHDTAWLASYRAQDVLAFIEATSRLGVRDGRQARSVYAAARALSGSPDEEIEGWLTEVAEYWATAPAPAAVYEGPRPQSGTPALLEGLWPDHATSAPGDQPGAAGRLLMFIALLHLAERPSGRRPRARVAVVLAGPPGGRGRLAYLELREARIGAAGIYPDPTSAALLATDHAFATAVARAWMTLPHRERGRCVLWSLAFIDAPATGTVRVDSIGGGSLGAAFALALRELARFPKPVRRPLRAMHGFLHGLRPKTAVTGSLDAAGELAAVDALESKADEVRRRGWRLIAPAANAAAGTVPEDVVTVARNLAQADRLARRWNRRHLFVSAMAALALSLPPGVITRAYNARTSRDAVIAAANQAAAVADTLLPSDAALAEYIAADAYGEAVTPQTRAALFRAATQSPHMVTTYSVGSAVTAVASSGNSDIVLAGTQDGTVTARSASGPVHRLLQLGRPVRALASDETGDRVAAVSSQTAMVWTAQPGAGETGRALSLPLGLSPTAVGVSPSGRYVIVAATSGNPASSNLLIFDEYDDRTSDIALSGFETPPSAMAVPSDSQVVLLDGSYGTWQRRSVPDAALLAGSTIGFGVHEIASALSADGTSASYTGGFAPTDIWRTQAASQLSHPQRVAPVGAPNAAALALSADGAVIAEADGTEIAVAPAAAPGTRLTQPTVLNAAGQVNTSALAFMGSSNARLVSASGTEVTTWDLNQFSRVGAIYHANVQPPCDSCTAPRVAVSPDGQIVAIVGGNGTTFTIRDLHAATADELGAVATSTDGFGPPLWADNGREVILPDAQTNGAFLITPRFPEMPVATGRWPSSPNALDLTDPAAALALSPDGDDVIEVQDSGTIEIRDTRTGHVQKHIDGPRDLSPTGGNDIAEPSGGIAIDPAASYVALLDAASSDDPKVRLIVTSLATGRQIVLPESANTSIAYAGEQLLIQQPSGTLQLWNSAATHLESTLNADKSSRMVSSGGTTLAELQTGDISLLDIADGYRLGTLPLPPAANGQPTELQFAPGGSALITVTPADYSGYAQIQDWDLDPQDWMAIACSTARLNISAAQWARATGTPPPASPACPS